MIQNRKEDIVKAIKFSRSILKSYNFILKIKLYWFYIYKPILHFYWFHISTNFTLLSVLG